MSGQEQTIRVGVDVSGLPETLALARAARDVVDRATRYEVGNEQEPYLVPALELQALGDALEPIMPGAPRSG